MTLEGISLIETWLGMVKHINERHTILNIKHVTETMLMYTSWKTMRVNMRLQLSELNVCTEHATVTAGSEVLWLGLFCRISDRVREDY